MTTYNEFVMVTDWEEVDVDDFYLTDKKWKENVSPETMLHAMELQAAGKLYIAYVVPAVHYVIYKQMDAGQIYIDEDGQEILSCEGEVIGNSHKEQFEYSY